MQLELSESADTAGRAAPWVGSLLVLGTRAARYARKTEGRQLVIALSVPKRDFAACLIGCGWILASNAPTLKGPLDTLREIKPGQLLRAVIGLQVVAGTFSFLDERARPPKVGIAGKVWKVDSIRALAPVEEIDQTELGPRPEPGSVERMAKLDAAWDERLAKPTADLAIVGTLKWLSEDLEAHVGRQNDPVPASKFGSLLMPKLGRVATWYTRIYSSSKLADQLPIPSDITAAILDGSGAIKYLIAIEAPVVICVLDRSVADESAAERVTQLRNTRGEPLSLSGDIGWSPPMGVEALAFTVAL